MKARKVIEEINLLLEEKPPKGSIEAAVLAVQLYMGSDNYASIRDQQRLYSRMEIAIQKIKDWADKHGYDGSDFEKQIHTEAERRGKKLPQVAKDI